MIFVSICLLCNGRFYLLKVVIVVKVLVSSL